MSGPCLKFSALYGSRKNNFNFLRLFFALLVILSHSYPIIYGTEAGREAEPLYRWSHGQIDFGALAVDAFFMISGFLLVGSWENSPGVLNFAGRRILRIYPGLIGCMIFCVFIAGPLGGADLTTYFTNPDTYRLFQYVFMRNFWNSVPGAFPHNPTPEIINSSLWTIKYEIFCYICLALLGLVRLLKPVPLLTITLAIFVFYNVLILRNLQPLFSLDSLPKIANDFLVDPMPRFLTFFLMGSVFYLWRDSIPHSTLLFALSLVLVLASYHYALDFTLPLFGGYALLYLGLTPKFHLPWFDKYDLSYGVYLFAWPVQQLALHYRWPGSDQPLLLFSLVLPPVFLLAALSWLCIEKPCLQFKKKRLKAATVSS